MNRPIRLLALVPPDEKRQSPSRFSFLSEEVVEMASAGIEVHTVSPYFAKTTKLQGVVVHPIPRLRQAVLSPNVARWFDWGRVVNNPIGQLHLAQTLGTIQRVLSHDRIDVIYSPFAWPGNTAGLGPARVNRVPVVVSLRGADALTEESIGYGCILDSRQRKQICRTLKGADHVIGVSKALADAGVELGADPKSVSVVLKGTREDVFVDGNRVEARHILGLEDRPTVLFVGHVIKRKGVYCLIDAMKQVRDCIPEVQLVICGEGEEFPRLKIAIGDAQLESHVVLAGRVSRAVIPDFFRASDVFVLPSLTEGSGNVLVEASSTARPCIGSDVAGIPDYIDDGETGLLFKKNDSRDLANKIVRILRSPSDAERMGRAGRARVLLKNRYSHMIRQLSELFESLIRID